MPEGLEVPWFEKDPIRLELRSAPDVLINPEIDIVWYHTNGGYTSWIRVDRYLNIPTGVKRLAMNYRTWHFLTTCTYRMYTAKWEEFKKLWIHNASELILVVNDRKFESHGSSDSQWFQDLIFVKPKPRALQRSKYYYTHTVFPDLQLQQALTWELMEENALKILNSLGRHANPEDPWRSKIKNIRFVEARQIGDRCLSKNQAALGRISPDVYLRE